MSILKQSRRGFTFVLTVGASLLLGLLSFSGMYAIFPLLGISIISMVLSVLYEGEIYHKNIQQALEKLANPHLLHEKIAKEALQLLEQDPDAENIDFLKNYQNCNNTNRRYKMLIWLGRLLAQPPQQTRPYQQQILQQFQKTNWSERLRQLQRKNRILIGFSVLTAICMSLGTIYLLFDTLEVLPILGIIPAQSPVLIISLSLIAGIAYSFLCYNSLASFLLDYSLKQWWQEFKQQLQQPINLKRGVFLIGAAILFTVNLALTLCTAGTWWTVMNQSRQTWSWLKNIGTRVIQWLTPWIMGLANLFFNSRNIIETVSAIQPKPASEHIHTHTHHHHKETRTQLWNPFRIFLKMTYMPLRVLLFLGHLVSIGVTGDRMPGVPAMISALLGIISEGFEDAHYFFDLDHQHDDAGHEHSDIPNQLLGFLFSPIFGLAATWHWYFQKPSQNKAWTQCYQLMQGHEHSESITEHAQTTQSQWDKEEALFTIEQHMQRLQHCYIQPEVAANKRELLQDIHDDIAQDNFITLQERIKNPLLSQHRSLFFQMNPSQTGMAMQEVAQILQPYLTPN